jgi:STE24 endopeptidase
MYFPDFATLADAVYTLPPDKLAKAIALSRWRNALDFGGVAWTLLALWLLLRFHAGPVLRDFAQRLTQRPWLQGLVVAPAWVLILTLLGLPLDLAGQGVELHYGLSVQPWLHGSESWLADFAKSTALSVLVGTAVLGAVYRLLRRMPRTWWLCFWLLTIPVEIAVVYAVPVIVDPLFAHFQPLSKVDPSLVPQLEQVVARGHLKIPPSRMFVMDASSKSTGINAYVTGFGASKRIVVWDNTIREVPPDEILMIYGHEQGHYALHHILKGLAFTALMLLIGYALANGLLHEFLHWRGRRWQIPSLDDWSSVGLLLLVVTLLSFVAEPIGNAFSRWEEHQADVYGQEVVHGLVPNPQQTAVRSFQRLGEIWLDNPHPNPFIVFWSYSHPSTTQRAQFAAHYDPWAPGHHPQFFRKP